MDLRGKLFVVGLVAIVGVFLVISSLHVPPFTGTLLFRHVPPDSMQGSDAPVSSVSGQTGVGVLSQAIPVSSPVPGVATGTEGTSTKEQKAAEELIQYVYNGIIHRGDTLYDVLQRAEVSPQTIYHITRALEPLFNPRNCRPGDGVEVWRGAEDGLLSLRYSPPGLQYYIVRETTSDEFEAEEKLIPRHIILVGAGGQIQTSLYEAMHAKDIDSGLIVKFADVFSWQIDFFTDPRKGDEFEVVWERYVDGEDAILEEGNIVAARYVNRGKEYTAVYFHSPDGSSGYYDENGESVRSSFLRSPLNYTRISSYFSNRRFHPILKIYRPHLGIDYAAPTGTPVCTIGDGLVTFAGRNGGFGIFVRVKHPNGYITSYGHLSRIATGIREGTKVSQGQVIGYVGATGLATGPHLDFRISKNGSYLNFLKLNLPKGTPVDEEHRDLFDKLEQQYAQYFSLLANAVDSQIVILSPAGGGEELVCATEGSGS